MNNPETWFLKNRFIRHLVDVLTDEKEGLNYKTPTRSKDFDEITKLVTISCLNVFIA